MHKPIIQWWGHCSWLYFWEARPAAWIKFSSVRLCRLFRRGMWMPTRAYTYYATATIPLNWRKGIRGIENWSGEWDSRCYRRLVFSNSSSWDSRTNSGRSFNLRNWRVRWWAILWDRRINWRRGSIRIGDLSRWGNRRGNTDRIYSRFIG